MSVEEQKWTLIEGLKLVRGLQSNVKEFGYHISLGGSVLNHGESRKDLDLYFHPLENGKENFANLISYLTKMWGEYAPIEARDYNQIPQGLGAPIQDDLEAEIANLWGRPDRIDPPAEPEVNPFLGPEAVGAARAAEGAMMNWHVQVDEMRALIQPVQNGAWVQAPPAAPAAPQVAPQRDGFDNLRRQMAEYVNLPYEVAVGPKKKLVVKQKSVYTLKAKFVRPCGDRIDVFII